MKKFLGLVLALALVLTSLAIAGEKVVYMVKKGDTLGELMFAWKVQGVDIGRIHKWNPNLGTQILVGQRIEYYLSDQPVSQQKVSSAEIKKIVDETIAAQKKYAPAAQPQAQASIFKMVAYLSAITLVIILLNILLDRRKKARKTKVQEIDTKEPTTETKWVEAGGYSVRIEIDCIDGEKRFYSPFTHASGLRIYEPSESKMISSLRRCLRPDTKFSGQLKSLEEAGVIKPLK